MTKCYDREKVDIDILKDLRVLSLTDYWKVDFGAPFVCM
jgi:hypothetical protein